MVSTKELFKSWVLGLLLFFCGFIQNFLVEGVEVLREQMGIEKNKDDDLQEKQSIYSSDKFYADVIQVAVLVVVRLTIESWLLPTNMKWEDKTKGVIVVSYLLSAMVSLLSTYMFSEIPKYRKLVSLFNHKNNQEGVSQEKINFVTSNSRIITQSLLQLFIPILIGWGSEELFHDFFKSKANHKMASNHDQNNNWNGLNCTQIVASISTELAANDDQNNELKALKYTQIFASISAGFATVILRKIVDYFFKQYYKQPSDRGWCPRLWSVLNLLGFRYVEKKRKITIGHLQMMKNIIKKSNISKSFEELIISFSFFPRKFDENLMIHHPTRIISSLSNRTLSSRINTSSKVDICG